MSFQHNTERHRITRSQAWGLECRACTCVSPPSVHRRTENKAQRQPTVFFCRVTPGLSGPKSSLLGHQSETCPCSCPYLCPESSKGDIPCLLAPPDTEGSLELNSGESPDEYPVLVSKVKHRFFSEENLYGLWNLEIILKSTIISGHTFWSWNC